MITLLSFLMGNRKKYQEGEDRWPVFVEGQRWRYQTRTGEEDSLITILKIEKGGTEDPVIHIRVEGIKIHMLKTPNGSTNLIEHMPFSETALCNSVTTLVGHSTFVPGFLPAYEEWKEACKARKGGSWTIELKEAINRVEKNVYRNIARSNSDIIKKGSVT